MNKNRKVIRIIVLLPVATLVVIFILKVVQTAKEMKLSFKDDLPRSFRLSEDDSSLIGRKYISDLTADEVFNNKNRHPITFARFRSKFELVIFKMDLEGDADIGKLLHWETGTTVNSSGVTYSNIEHDKLFNLSFLDEFIHSVSQLYLTFDSDSLILLPTSDTVLSFNLRCRKFSVQNSPRGSVLIFFSGLEGPLAMVKPLPVSLTFLRREKALYMLIMVPDSINQYQPTDLLDKIVRDK